MNERIITNDQIADYAAHLHSEERAPGTIEKYLRDARSFAVWLDGAPVTKENANQLLILLLCPFYHCTYVGKI